MKTCPVHTDSASPSSSWLYLLERFDVGVVHVDRELRVTGMNDFARRSLPVQDKLPPMATMINIPDRVLLIKVSKMGDAQGATAGYTLVFYDITDVVSHKAQGGLARGGAEAAEKRPEVGNPGQWGRTGGRP